MIRPIVTAIAAVASATCMVAAATPAFAGIAVSRAIPAAEHHAADRAGHHAPNARAGTRTAQR